MRRRPLVIPPEVLLGAYARGYFPMADDKCGELQWYTADPRAVLPLPLHVPRRLARTLRGVEWEFTRDADFEAVVRACADRDSTWISEDIVQTYLELHRAGHAHSVEVWEDEALIGGLYGVHLGAAFFGESVFNRVPNAGKAAVVHLGEHLQARGFRLLEVQMITDLTAQFGAVHVSRAAYRRLLAEALRRQAPW